MLHAIASYAVVERAIPRGLRPGARQCPRSSDFDVRAKFSNALPESRSWLRPVFLGARPADYVFQRSNRVSPTIHVRSGARARSIAGGERIKVAESVVNRWDRPPPPSPDLTSVHPFPDMAAKCPPWTGLPSPSPHHFHWNPPLRMTVGGRGPLLRRGWSR